MVQLHHVDYAHKQWLVVQYVLTQAGAKAVWLVIICHRIPAKVVRVLCKDVLIATLLQVVLYV